MRAPPRPAARPRRTVARIAGNGQDQAERAGGDQRLHLLGISGAAASIRVAAWSGGVWSGHYRRLVKDEAGYVALGRRFREAYRTPPTEQFKRSSEPAGPGSEWTLYDLTLLRPPGYPAALAALLVPGRTVGGAMFLQAVLGAGVVPAAYATAQAMGASTSVALVAGALAAVEPMAIGLSVRPLSESVTTHLLASGVVLWTSALSEWRRGQLAAAGLLIGLATMSRPTTLYFGPVAAVVTFAAGRLGGVTPLESCLGAVLIAGSTLVLPLCWGIRNYAVTGVPIFSSIEGLNALEFHAAQAVAIAEGIPFEEARDRLVEEFLHTDPPLEPPRRSRAQLLFALDVLRDNVAPFVRSAARGAKVFILSPGFPYAIEVFGGDGYRPRHLAGRLFAGFSWLHLAVLYAGAARGATILIRSKRTWAVLPVASLLGYTVVLTAGGDTVSRFRAPLLPALSALSAVGWVRGGRVRRRNQRTTSRAV